MNFIVFSSCNYKERPVYLLCRFMHLRVPEAATFTNLCYHHEKQKTGITNDTVLVAFNLEPLTSVYSFF